MGIFLVYIVKSSLCLALFYLFYRLLLSRETFHRFNRIALLGITLFSALLPLIRITVEQPMAVAASVMSAEELWLMQQWNVQAVVSEESRVPFSVSIASAMVYLCGIAFLLLRNLWSLSRLLFLIRHSRKVRLESGAWLVIHRQQLAPFSWMKFVVVSQKDLDEGGRDILIHEQAHIAKGHSWDLLWMEICVWLQWFNPAAWLLKQEIQNIHEYEADEEVLRSGVDARQYQMLLIKKAVGARLYSIANSLNHSSLKKRITMMVRKKSNPWARAKYLYVLPLAAVAVAAFARPEISVPLEEISSVKVNDLSAIVEQPDVKKSVPAAAIRQEASSGKARLNMRVVDEAGKPLSGATVVIVNTNVGAVTGKDGSFQLDAGTDQRICVSYVGKETLVLPVEDCLKNKDGRVCLKEETARISSELVVTDVPQKVTESGETFTVVEQMPAYPGGMGECLKFLATQIKYPEEAVKAGVQGRVIAQFTVRKDGTLSDLKILRSIHPALDAEALRVIALMPKWQPGMQRGEAVDVRYTIPVSFSLDKQHKAQPVGTQGAAPAGEVPARKSGPVQSVSGQIYSVVDQMPEYPGGMKECMKFMAEQIKYPAEAVQKKVQGRVIVQFVVRKDGTLGNITVLRSVDPLLDAEAIRVIGQMPKWKPGMAGGEAVNVKFTLPVSFRLNKEKAASAAAPGTAG